jgi:hypothetical protein
MDVLNIPWVSNLLVEIVAGSLLLAAGFLVGKHREDDYDFYPYESTRENFAEFSIKDFRLGVHYFLRNTDMRAARQLIFIGEQNGAGAARSPTTHVNSWTTTAISCASSAALFETWASSYCCMILRIRPARSLPSRAAKRPDARSKWARLRF